jgi:hypothetical protein
MKAKNVWRQPVLTIIKRFQPEENVLSACKGTDFSGYTLGSNGRKQGCYQTSAGPTCSNPCNILSTT